ncbi:MAG: aminotransferase class I/II-fold pyridoxal phosphate-dependent enzyme, partial [Paracoccaceae bacterium]
MHKNDYEIGSEIRTWGVNIPKRAIVELEKTFASGWINTGPREKQFRQLLTEAFEANHAIACNSGTSALKLALAAAKVGPGDEVISTPYTWLATNTAILEVGAIPVFADIGASSLNIDPDSVADKITSKTKAIMCVHFAGNACDLHRLRDIAATNQLPLIEDCAHSMGAKYDGKMIGNGAHFACFSFQCVKIVTCGDGGAVLTSDAESYDTLKRLSWYGVDRDQKKLTFFDSVPMFPEELGFKMNMNDITATMACVAMEELPHALKQRKELGKIYDEHMVKLERVRAVSRHNLATPNYQI